MLSPVELDRSAISELSCLETVKKHGILLVLDDPVSNNMAPCEIPSIDPVQFDSGGILESPRQAERPMSR